MNVISVLQKIAAMAETIDGQHVTPVAWDCNCLEEVCGACTMVINGRVRQACSALVDRLLEDNPDEIELRPVAKFPVVRDLFVDRSRMFQALKKIKGWIPTDGYYDHGPGPRSFAGGAAAGLSAERVHDLWLLPGSMSAVSQGGAASARRGN